MHVDPGPVTQLSLPVTAVSDEAGERRLSAPMPCYTAGKKAEGKHAVAWTSLPKREVLLRWVRMICFTLTCPAHHSAPNWGLIFFTNQKRENQRNQTGVTTFKLQRVKWGSRQNTMVRLNRNSWEGLHAQQTDKGQSPVLFPCNFLLFKGR